jgi:hypothetical protein
MLLLGVLQAQAAGGGGLGAIAGYIAGGSLSAVVDKFAFPSDSRTTLATGLSINRRGGGGASNLGVAVYVGGGAGPTTLANLNSIDRFDFSGDTRTTLAATLSVARRLMSGMSDSGVAGYFAGGFTSADSSVVDKLNFSNETCSALATGMSQATSPGGMSNVSVAGYISVTTAVDKFAFPSDSRTTLATGLSSSRQQLAGVSNNGVAGYFGGGNGPSAVVDKFAFPSDSRTTLATGLSIARALLAGMSSLGVAGYFGGGLDGGTSFATVDKFAFPSDTRTTLGTGLSSARNAVAGMEM